MTRRYLFMGAFMLSVLSLALTPLQTRSTNAQMEPMTAQIDHLSGDEFDRAFLMQMSMHHAMAVMMARPVVANAAHQELREFGNQIIADQTAEIAQMRTWARDWYGMDIPDMVAMMEAMPVDHDMAGHGPMGQSPGAAQQGMPMQMGEMSMMADLWKLPPSRQEAVFMSLMVPHHQGAIEMAALAADRAAHQELKDLAQTIVSSQSTEVDQLNAWLTTWYAL